MLDLARHGMGNGSRLAGQGAAKTRWPGWTRCGSRITAIHVKDIAPAGECVDEDGWADVGHGTLDWKSLIASAKQKTKAKYFVAEHDKPNDAVRFARRSIESVKKWM